MEYSSPIGALTLISDSEALLSLEFEQKRYPFSLPERCQLTVLPGYSGNREGGEGRKMLPAPLLQAARWLDCYFSGKSPDFLPPLKPEGSPFRRRVWEERAAENSLRNDRHLRKHCKKAGRGGGPPPYVRPGGRRRSGA